MGALTEAAWQLLESGGVEDARRNVDWMMEEVLGLGRAQRFAFPERSVAPEQVAVLDAMVQRRLQGEPLQYVLGHADFYGLRLRVTPDVLIPRPETEQVVEAALETIAGVPAPRVLDVGTGSGCIPLAIRHSRPDADVYGCDISEAALDVARDNAGRLGVPVTFLQADVLDASFPGAVPGALDLLVSNPPYIPEREAPTLAGEVRDHEPHVALFSGDDPFLFYRAVLGHAPALLADGGRLVFETHASYGEAVRDLVRSAGLARVELRLDLAGLPRIVMGRKPG